MNRDPRLDNREFQGRGYNQNSFYNSQVHRSRSPRPGPQREAYKRPFEQRNHYNGRFNGRQFEGFQDYNQGPSERLSPEQLAGEFQAREVSKSDMFKKKRTDFPEQILYEFRFFASPPRFQNFEQVLKLADPNSDKNEVEEFLSILSNN